MNQLGSRFIRIDQLDRAKYRLVCQISSLELCECLRGLLDVVVHVYNKGVRFENKCFGEISDDAKPHGIYYIKTSTIKALIKLKQLANTPIAIYHLPDNPLMLKCTLEDIEDIGDLSIYIHA